MGGYRRVERRGRVVPPGMSGGAERYRLGCGVRAG